LFAQFVSCYPIKSPVSFYWDGFDLICINGMFASFSQEDKTIFFKIVY